MAVAAWFGMARETKRGGVDSCIDSGFGDGAWRNGSTDVLKFTVGCSVGIAVELRDEVVCIGDAFDNLTLCFLVLQT